MPRWTVRDYLHVAGLVAVAAALGLLTFYIASHFGLHGRWANRGAAILAAVIVAMILALVSAPFFIRSIVLMRQRRRWAREGRCLFCGYDLRASTERCPECGAMKPRYPPHQ